MTGRTAGRIANAVSATSLLFLIVSSVPPLRRQSSGDPGDAGYIIAIVVGLAIYLAIGRAIVRRDPTNTIGWLLLLIPLITSLGLAVGVYATTALVDRPGSLPFGVWSAWLDRWLLPAMLSSFIFIFLLYPDGHLPSRRWRPVLRLTVVAAVITALSFAVTPGRMTGSQAHLDSIRVDNPLGLDGWQSLVNLFTVVGSLLLLLSAFLAGAAVVIRYRGSTVETRQQIRWLALVGVTFLVTMVLMIVAGSAGASEAIGNVLFTVLFATLALGIPIACGIAILRYRLYDLDIVIKKTVVFGLLAGFISLLYVLVAVLPLTVLGAGGSDGSSSILPFAGTVLLVLLFQPVRHRAQRFADRVVYGERATPYEVLSEFSSRLGEAYATEDVLPRTAQILANATGGRAAFVWLRVGSEIRPAAVWPQGELPSARAMHGNDLPAVAGGEHVEEVRHQGELLGALSVVMPANDPMDPTRERMVKDLAGQAGLVLRNVRLIEDLRASRQRLVAAQDEERRRIERNIHDGAQQQLVALAVQLKLARTMMDRDPEKAGPMLDGLQVAATTALEDLRDLARGIYPPLLADKGLTAALEAQARKAVVPVTVSTQGVGRYAQEIEAAVYFCSLEALNNVAKYARASAAQIHLAQENGDLSFTVHDDGDGFDPSVTGYGSGLHGMADRLDAIGGNLQVESAPGRGTVIRGRVPAGAGGGA